MFKVSSNFIALFSFLIVSVFFGVIAYYIHENTNPTKKLKNQIFCDGQIINAYFSPEDKIKYKLINLIKHEKKSLSIAIYTITDKEIAQSIINAYLRDIKVEIVADKSYGSSTYSKIPMLANKRIPIWIYQAPESLLGENNKLNILMHNKFIIFGKNIDNRSLVWTGSFNFTKSANSFNQENVIITDNSKVVDQFKNNFNKLKSLSLLISGSSKSNFIYQKPKISWINWLLNGEWLSILDGI